MPLDECRAVHQAVVIQTSMISENMGARTAAHLTEQHHSKALITLSMEEVSVVLSNVSVACAVVA
jgi:hypothetical protein